MRPGFYRRMGSEFNWTGKFSSPTRPGAQPVQEDIPDTMKATKSEQQLCDELFNLGDIMSVHIFSMEGEILGTNFGDVVVDDELRETFGEIAANVWAGIRKGEPAGGQFMLTTITYERFKIVGIPFERSGIGVLAVVEDKVDAMYVKDRIVEFVSYWVSINKLRRRVGESRR